MHHQQVIDHADDARLATATTEAAAPLGESIILPAAIAAAPGTEAPALAAVPPRSPGRVPSPFGQAMAILLVDAVSLVLAATALVLAAPAQADLGGATVAAYPALVLLLLATSRRYRPRWSRTIPSELRGSLSATAVGALVLSAASLLLVADPLTSTQLVWLWAVSGIGLCVGDVVVAAVTAGGRRRGALTAPTLIVGAGRVGHLVARRLLDRPELGLRPIGFLDNDPLGGSERAVDLPVLGSKEDLEDVIREHRVARVVIAFSTGSDQLLLSVARRCGALGVSVSIVPRLYELEGTRPSALHLGGLPLVELPFENPDRLSLRAKYAMDRIVGSMAWIAMAPILGAIAIAIRVRMGRPVLHRQERVGRDGQVFTMLKFRTMRGGPAHDGEADAEWLHGILGPDGNPLLPTSDAPIAPRADRTTRLGRFLRRYSLDELPQLWNVIVGNMSLVGPRPERVTYVDRLAPVVYRYGERHRVKPGITGWAQVNGLRGKTSLADRIEWDNFYVESWSAALDLEIIARTASCVLRGSPEDGVSDRGAEREARGAGGPRAVR